MYLEYDKVIPFLTEYIKNPVKHEKVDTWAKISRDMSIHLDGVYPTELIQNRRPGEDDARLEFRRLNYQPITKGVLAESINSLFRIFDKRNYSIEVSEDVENYLYSDAFSSNDFMSWVQNYLTYLMLLDPNGRIVVLPSGEGLTDNTKPVVPKNIYVSSKQIRACGQNYLLFESDSKSKVGYGNYRFDQAKGSIYWMLTDTHIWKIEQIGKYNERRYEIIEYYRHDQRKLPAITLGGIWNQSKEAFDSYFDSFVAFGNQAIAQYSDYNSSLTVCGYPTKIIRHIECNFPQCNNGFIYPDGFDENGSALRPYPCRKCGGTGQIPASTPFGVIEREEYNPALDGDKSKLDNRPPLEYVAPPVGILDYAGKAWENMLVRGEKALHIDTEKLIQSGVAKEYDREREYAMLLSISNNIFNNVYDLLYIYEKYINPFDAREPVVIYPRQFSLKSSFVLQEEFKQLGDDLVDTKTEIAKEIVTKRYEGDVKTQNVQLFLIDYDSLYVYSTTEKLALLAAGVIENKDVVRSIQSMKLVYGYLNERPDFNFNESAQVTALTQFLDAKIEELTPKKPEIKFPSDVRIETEDVEDDDNPES